MFDIAADVSRYKEFVPWCNDSAVIRQIPPNSFEVRLGVGFPPLSETYHSTVTLRKPGHVRSIAQDCYLFNHLVNEWNFRPGLADNPQTCTVEFAVSDNFPPNVHCTARNSWISRSCCRSPAFFSLVNSVITERLGRLLLIGINRPQQHNVIDRVTAHQLTHLMREQFEADPNILAGVLYGCGEDFCTGLDCEELADSKGTCLELYGLDENKDTGPMGPTRMMFSKPLIAAITGKAIGGGLELALACDLRVAETDSVLGLHPRKYSITSANCLCPLGLPMMDMGAQRLPVLIGLSRALDLVLTGRSLNGTEGYQFGLVNRVVKPGTAIGAAVDLANAMCNLPGQKALLLDRNATIQAAVSKTVDSEMISHYRTALRTLSSESLPG
ncbi:putative enoyl-coa hydratase [Fasciolopsis buskii]|uniref:Putative enoyl-coa hydratase n=1 Tax=Fasciolopsis buskii TaxID=27845 RepID=A0A8E0VE13_9TREM|nr:putative enoyl-coa hydratase [Fasciolopsis buski]